MQDTGQDSSLFEDTQVAFSHVTDKELQQAFRLFRTFNNPLFLKVGKVLTNIAFKLKLPIESLLKKTIYHHFCAGETLEECRGLIQRLGDFNINTALQYSVETKTSDDEYDHTTRELTKAIHFAEGNTHVKFVCCKLSGIGGFDRFEKLTANDLLSIEDKHALENIRKRMESICSAAEKAGVSIFFDAEESWIQPRMDKLIDEMMLKYNQKKVIVYATFQLYRSDRLVILKATFQKAKDNNIFLGAKLVRGAYMEKERDRAMLKSYPSPVYPDKVSVDKAYNEALEFCVNHLDRISVCAATHNEQSCTYLMGLLHSRGIKKDHPHILFSQLYGMGEHLTYNLAKHGFTTIKLLPYGPVREAIPYLIRRAEENSSIAGQVGRELQLLEKEMKRRGLR